MKPDRLAVASPKTEERLAGSDAFAGTGCVGTILGVKVQASSYETVVERSLAWARRGESRALFFSAVHMVMEAVDQPEYRRILNAADMVNPDGMPVVWALRALGESGAQRVYGPDATLAMLAAAEKNRIPVGFYGGSPQTMQQLLAKLRLRFPALAISFSLSPPFRALTLAEDETICEEIRSSGTRILFIGLGCPKQEIWVSEHLGRIPAVMFAVGAAFDFLAGNKRQAPRWMMRVGLEWVFRLLCEPRRLALRYLKHNPRFVVFVLRQLLLRQRMGSKFAQ